MAELWSSAVGRRRLLTGAGAVGASGLLAAGLAACGGGTSGSGAEGAGAGGSGAGGGGFPVRIDHQFGATLIPEAPKRVVLVGYTDQDAVLALGLKPVGVREWFGNHPFAAWPWTKTALGAAKPTVLGSSEVKFEQIAALRPDLIIGEYSQLTSDEYRKLSQLAPTVAQSKKYPAFAAPWQEMTTTIGRAVGREARAKQLITSVEARFTAVKKANPAFAGKSAVVMDGGSQAGAFSLLSPDDQHGRVMRSLGFVSPPEIAKQIPKGQFGTPLSRERFDLVDADVLICLIYDPKMRAKLVGDPLFQRLKVAQRGGVIFLDSEDPVNAAMGFSTVLSLPYFLTRFEPMLAAAVKKIPAR